MPVPSSPCSRPCFLIGVLSVHLFIISLSAHLFIGLSFPVTPILLGPAEQQRVMLLSRSPSGPRKFFPIPVGLLEEEIRLRSADDGKRFREEFNVSLFV